MGLTAPSRRVSYLLELLLLLLDSVISIVHNKPFNLIFQIDLPSFFISSCERVSKSGVYTLYLCQETTVASCFRNALTSFLDSL